jgi:hypothetical protein
VLVPLSDAVPVALPDCEEADAVAVAMLGDVRMRDAPAPMLKTTVSLNVPKSGTVKIVVAPSILRWSCEVEKCNDSPFTPYAGVTTVALPKRANPHRIRAPGRKWR